MHGMIKTCRGCGREFHAGETFCPNDGSRLSSISQAHDMQGVDPLIGVTLDGRYRLLRAIGEGGMGVVYEAEHVLLEKRVAVKVLREGFSKRSDVVERFRQEAKSASRIGHPNIVDVSDFGETPAGASYIVMEMLKGEDLADVLSRECALSPLRAAHIAFQVARALGATHQKNIIHRDLKPENIYLISRNDQPDFVKVVDFGVAKMGDIESLGGRKLTRTGMIFGTPEYMSPEHAAGQAIDHRVDVYALGVILYETLTGRVPFEGDNFMDVLSKHGRDPVPALRSMNPGTRVSPELERVVFRALEKDPGARYATMEEFAGALRATPELPSVLPHDSVVPPEWTRSAPPAPPPRVSTSTSPVEAPVRHSVPWRASLRDRRVQAAVAIGTAVVILAALVASLRKEPEVAVTAMQPTAAPVMRAPERVLVATPPPPAALDVPDTAPTTVAVTLRTQPSGARAEIDGVGQVCARTPCVFEAPAGQEITLRVRGNNASVVRTVSFVEPTALQLKLGATKAPAPTRLEPAKAPPAVSDLKVPSLFR
jgi:eukaryotic-like serine/threonine-protein kinase